VVRDVGNRCSRLLLRAGLRAPAAAENWRAYVSLTDAESRAAFVRTLRAVVDVGGQSVSAHDRLYLARHMPTLIIWGAHDPIIPLEHARDAHEAMPGSRLEIFEHSRHYPHCEEPERFVDVVADFMATTDPAPSDPAAWRAALTAG
jgi:pimeloyl-ACP methyl ester carboxylesterase